MPRWRLEEYYEEWRTFQMSDHLPLWVEVEIALPQRNNHSLLRQLLPNLTTTEHHRPKIRIVNFL